MKTTASSRGKRGSWWAALGRTLLPLALLAGFTHAQAATVIQSNLADLIEQSERILVGTVANVTDGFTADRVPYTEVTVNVTESMRGDNVRTYTFRQFGLKEPREIDGRTYLVTTPDGWPTWSEQETVMLFLNPPARFTGLQTTVGLELGKLRLQDGRLANAAHNRGLFRDLRITAGGLSEAQREMLASDDGHAVDLNPFISLVRRAVDENWIEHGVMRHAQ
jgi:hypothetical protein